MFIFFEHVHVGYLCIYTCIHTLYISIMHMDGIMYKYVKYKRNFLNWCCIMYVDMYDNLNCTDS